MDVLAIDFSIYWMFGFGLSKVISRPCQSSVLACCYDVVLLDSNRVGVVNQMAGVSYTQENGTGKAD